MHLREGWTEDTVGLGEAGWYVSKVISLMLAVTCSLSRA